MNLRLVIRGRYSKQAFIPSDPMPVAEGTAELVINPEVTQLTTSLFDLMGKAEHLQTTEDIMSQVQEERSAWGES